MTRRAYVSDRSTWSPGPWNKEPDEADFVAAGLPCFIQRNDDGAWCGYVGVTKAHPLFGVRTGAAVGALRAHGGVSFAGKTDRAGGRWWLGFDCGHIGDSTPRRPTSKHIRLMYCNIGYALRETVKLAEQLAEMPSQPFYRQVIAMAKTRAAR